MSEPQFHDDIPGPRIMPIALTQAQRAVYDSIRDHGILHYYGAPMETEAQLRPRLYPLLAGPTGSGKSLLIEQAARELQADYFRISYGDFIPMGARDLTSATLIRLGRKLARSHRLVVHVDELDKWLVGDREWGRAITTDLLNLLDGRIPWEQILALESEAALKDTLAEGVTPGAKVREEPPPQNLFRIDHMWVVGSGTWQAVFERSNSRAIGFQFGEANSNGGHDLAAAIRKAKVIPTELSARFATDILVIGYPSRAETEHLLEIYGLKQLAAGMGMVISADDVDYSVSGMRALESLKTRLLLENLRRRRRDDLLEMIAPPDLNSPPAA